MRDFSLPLPWKWDLSSSSILLSADWYVTDVSGQPISPIFEGQAVQEYCEHLGMQLCM